LRLLERFLLEESIEYLTAIQVLTMTRRFIYPCSAAFAAGTLIFSLGAAPQALQADAPALDNPAPVPAETLTDVKALAEKGIDILQRGPVHEAYAQPIQKNPEPGPVITKRPPKPIEELPPDQKPEGDNVQWIKGYWAWDTDKNDFLWVSGFWRAPPPGRHWVAGYWTDADGGWRYVPGYWASDKQAETTYLPAPPESLDYGPTTPAPSDECFYVPGNWVYGLNRYAWRPGYWAYPYDDYLWNPATYYWTPDGYTYSDGYWDYYWPNRGLLFAPIWFHRPWFWHSGFCFRPFFCVNPFFTSSFFFHSGCNSFFFGGFHDPFFHNHGFHQATIVNNNINITNINNNVTNANNVTNVNTNVAAARTRPVVSPLSAANVNKVHLGATSTASQTRLGATSASARGPAAAVHRQSPVIRNGSSFASASHGQAPVIRSPSTFSSAPRGQGPTIISHNPSAAASHFGSAVTHGQAPTIQHAPSVTHRSFSAPSVSHAAPQISHSAPAHFSAPSHYSAPSHFSAPSHYSAPSHFSGGGGHFGGGGGAHFSGGGGHSSGGGGHSSGGGGHSGGGSHSGGHGHR
jgi:hypothetical protein